MRTASSILFSPRVESQVVPNTPKLQAESAIKLSQVEGAKIYAELKKEVEAAGILERDYKYYTLLSLLVFTGFSASLYFVIISSNFFMYLASGLCLGFFTVQVAGLMHDCVHRSIFKSPKVNDFFGYIVSAIGGITYNDWKGNHERHHANPNAEEEDPDINLPLLSFSRERYLSKKGVSKILRKYQAYLYYPMGILVAFTIRVGNFVYFKKNFRYSILWEFGIYIIGLFVWFVLPFLVFDLTKAVVLFLTINSTAGIYLFNIFAPNHKGMPEINKDDKYSFLEQQIITARNIYGHPVTDIVYLGLNYQIEHHLFPNCPRNKLKLITPFLKKMCARMELDYTEVGIINSNRMILKELQKIAIAA